MKTPSLIYIRLEYDEAVKSKKEILASQMNLLRMLKIIKMYHSLRSQELKTKIRLYKKIKELKASISSLQQILPKIKLPEILKKDDEELEEKPKIKHEKYHQDLDSQLQEIQEKLKKLQD